MDLQVVLVRIRPPYVGVKLGKRPRRTLPSHPYALGFFWR